MDQYFITLNEWITHTNITKIIQSLLDVCLEWFFFLDNNLCTHSINKAKSKTNSCFSFDFSPPAQSAQSHTQKRQVYILTFSVRNVSDPPTNPLTLPHAHTAPSFLHNGHLSIQKPTALFCSTLINESRHFAEKNKIRKRGLVDLFRKVPWHLELDPVIQNVTWIDDWGV